jgi:hypothetical protein
VGTGGSHVQLQVAMKAPLVGQILCSDVDERIRDGSNARNAYRFPNPDGDDLRLFNRGGSRKFYEAVTCPYRARNADAG